MRPLLLLPLNLLFACVGEEKDLTVDTDSGYLYTDDDGDGAESVGTGGDDCDDGDPAVHPGAAEQCDGVDNDCDGQVDDEDAEVVGQSSWYADADGDGFGDMTISVSACNGPEGLTEDSADCDDSAASVHPGAEEVCNGFDDDCDALTDEADPSLDDEQSTWYADADGDGYGDDAVTVSACEAPDGYSNTSSDCDDADAGVFPYAVETCDGLDEDCDGEIDEETTGSAWYWDSDDDGYGDPDFPATACDQPIQHMDNALDCDDLDADISPDATELCDEVDNDCDGVTDEDDAADATIWYADADADGEGDASSTAPACEQPAGHVANDDDCDDGDPSIYAAADELCTDGIDNNCDGAVDDGDLSTWYADSDADGFGDADTSVTDCAAPTGYTADDTDCDDTDASVSPSGTDSFNGVDDDCDGAVDFVTLSSADAARYGIAGSDGVGDAIAGASDVNGDGYDDLLIGANGDDTAASLAGAAYVVLGPVSGAASLSSADASLLGIASTDQAGWVVAGPGDADGDGYADLFVGTAYAEEAYLVSGPVSGSASLSTATATWTAAATGDGGGQLVARAGDTDGDGAADLLFGADDSKLGASYGGAVFLVLGPGSSEKLSGADAIFMAENAYDDAGVSTRGVGDTDGDGLADIAVGAGGEDTGASAAGAVYVLTGPQSGSIDLSAADAKLLGEAASDTAGNAVSGAGDADGDGLDDLVIGAYASDGGGGLSGAAYLVLGPVSGTSSLSAAEAVLIGAAGGDYAGGCVDGVDANGDGYSDLLIGGDKADAGGTDRGAAWLVFAPVSGTVSLGDADARFGGVTDKDYAGVGVARAGDTDGDGIEDLIVGADYEDTGGSAAGAVYLVMGRGI